jgi:hypothetical protein
MPLITGLIKDSGGTLIDGVLRVRLDAPMVDRSTTPDSLHTSDPREFEIVDGVLPTVNLPESQSQQITYEFTIFRVDTVIEFYFSDGTRYDGPTHQHTDSKWYTGYSHRAESVELDRVVGASRSSISQFHAIVPNLLSVEFAALLPTRISTDTLPTSIRQIAEILTTTAAYREQLRGGPRPRGNYSSTTFYERDDQVIADGSSWIYINSLTTAGNPPPVLPATSNSYWQLLAGRGASGAGTSGNDTPYDPIAWDGQTDAPSRNAMRDVIQTLARLSDIANLAPLLSPVFQGNPSRNTAPLLSDNSSQIPTTNWVRGYAAPIDSPAFINNPSAPTQALTDVSNKLSTTKFVDDYFRAKNFGVLVLAEVGGSNQPLTSGVAGAILFSNEISDSGGLFNAATGVFTPGVSGIVRFAVKLWLSASTALNNVDIGVYEMAGGTRIDSLFNTNNYPGTVGVFSVFADVSVLGGVGYQIRVNCGGTSPFAPAIAGTLRSRLTIQQLSLL